MINYEKSNGEIVYTVEWINPNGINEWDADGENPLDIKTYRTEMMNCHFNSQGECIHIGDDEVGKVEGIVISEQRKVYTNPMEGRFIKI
jgi:hypothetical protein